MVAAATLENYAPYQMLKKCKFATLQDSPPKFNDLSDDYKVCDVSKHSECNFAIPLHIIAILNTLQLFGPTSGLGIVGPRIRIEFPGMSWGRFVLGLGRGFGSWKRSHVSLGF